MKRQRRNPNDALRWAVGMIVTAILASAVTSAVFMAMRPRVGSEQPVEQLAQSAAREYQQLAPSFKTAAETLAKERSNLDSGEHHLDVELRLTPAQQSAAPVSLADDRNMVPGASPANTWRLDAKRQTAQWKFIGISDIRRSNSLANPGYVGIARYEVSQQQRSARRSGELPLVPPGEVYESPVAGKLVSYDEATGVQKLHLANWRPVDPPPAEFPPTVQAKFHEAITACLEAAPTVSTGEKSVTFYYSIRDGKWTPSR